MTVSCLYRGTIRHRRTSPAREFRHPIALAYVDLAEVPELLGGRLLRRGPGQLRFRRRDYLRPTDRPLDEAVRDRVQELGGARPAGPIRLLTQLRSFGLCFNPVSFYYCFEPDGERLACVLADVTNTPWGERYSYLIGDRAEATGVLTGSFAKQLHVSPFMGMDHVYDARAAVPGETLSVHIASRRGGETAFDATLAMERRELTRAAVTATSARFPFATARVIALIYGHAVGLKLAGVRIHSHPRTAAR